MANQSVLELAVGTGKWDAGLKKAKQSLDNFTQANGGLQQALEKESQKMQKFVQMMGGMESTAKTAKGQMNDYKSTIEQLTMQYNRMTEAQKKTIGQDYLQAIDQMKQKYQSVNEEIQEMNRSLKNIEMPEMKGGGLFSGMGDKMSGALQVFAGNMMTKAVGAVASLGSELMETAKQSVELAQQGEGVRIAFERLNNPGLLANLKEATHGTVSELELMKAAVKFDDFKLPVEELGTLLAFAQKKASDTGQSVDYMVDSIVTGLGRKSLMILDNLGLSASEVKDRMAETGDMTKAVADIIREEMEKSGGYVETAATRAARATAQAQDKMMDLGRAAMPVAEAYNEAWGEIRLGAMQLMTTVLVPIANFLRQLREESNMTAEDILTRGMDDVTDTVDDNGRLIRKNAISSIPEITVSGTSTKKKTRSGGSSRSGKGGPSMPKNVRWDHYIDKVNLGADALKGNDTANFLSPYSMMLDDIKAKILDVKDADLGSALEIPDVYKQKMDEYAKGVTALKTSISTTASLVGTIGQAFNAIEDPAAKVAAVVAQAIANVALAYSDALAKTTDEKFNIWGFIAAAAASTVSMVSTIASIHSATGYAQGGMIKGNSYSGDNIGGLVDGSGLVGLNAGELVLNAAQQSNLANSLQGNGGNTVRVVGKIAGKDLFICAENWAKSVGKGEFVTW